MIVYKILYRPLKSKKYAVTMTDYSPIKFLINSLRSKNKVVLAEFDTYEESKNLVHDLKKYGKESWISEIVKDCIISKEVD